MPEEGLCCCEYINDEGETSHLITTCCNCEALDLLVDRLVKCEGMDKGLLQKLKTTIADRMRIPWINGAIKVSPSFIISVVSAPLIILLGSLSLAASIITYVVLVPTLLYGMHRRVNDMTKQQLNLKKCSSFKEFLETITSPAKFYPVFLACSFLWLWYTFIKYIIPQLKINALESLLAHSLCGLSLACLLVCSYKSCEGFCAPSASEVDILESGGVWRLCGECDEQVPVLASHCRICNTCYLLRDHHCVWLNCCISRANDRWFVSGLCVGACALSYVINLTATCVCTPRYLIYNSHFSLLLPHDCSFVYDSWKSAISVSLGGYLLLLLVLVCCVLLQQVLDITRGIKFAGKNRRRLFRDHKNGGSGAAPATPGTKSILCTLKCCGCAIAKWINNSCRFWFNR